MFYKHILKNGLTILKIPIPAARSVLVDFFVKTGSRQETPRQNGISHFLEHLFFKGSRKYPSAQALSHALDAIGAEYNANTGKEHTQFYIKAAKKHFTFIFEVLTDMLQNPLFAEEEIEREKGVIIEEINMYEDTPMRHVEDLLEETMWPDHPLGRNIAGTKKVIRSIMRRDIQNYVRTFYQPSNMIVGVAGAYDDKKLGRLLRLHWEGMKNHQFPHWENAKRIQKRPALKIQHKKTEQNHLAFGFRSYHYNHPRYVPQIVLAAILGGGMSSRLFTEIREKRGWAYYVKASPTSYQDTGLFAIQAGVRVGALSKVVDTVMRELSRLRTEPVEESELKKVKEYLKGTMTLSLEEKETKLAWYLEQMAFRRKVLEPEKIFTQIDKVTPQDLVVIAREIFRKDRLNLAIIGRNVPGARIKKYLYFPN